MIKNQSSNAGAARAMVLIPGSARFPWRRKWQPTPVFLPGESHGQRSLVGYHPWVCKELDTTEQLTVHLPHMVYSQPPLNMGWGEDTVWTGQHCVTDCREAPWKVAGSVVNNTDRRASTPGVNPSCPTWELWDLGWVISSLFGPVSISVNKDTRTYLIDCHGD